MKALFYVIGGIMLSMVVLALLAGAQDAAERMIYGDEAVNQEEIDAQRQLDYTAAVMHQRQADDAALEAAEEQAKADEARRKMDQENGH